MKYNIEIDEEGNKRYYVKNVLHREDGPAVEFSNGSKIWFKNGKLHRENGPSAEYDNGSKEWHKNGQFHREDGPAREFKCGDLEWWCNGICFGSNNDFTNESWKRFVKTLIFS